MNPLASLAPAIKDIASAQKTSFATTQAVWRFLNNDKISFKQLNEPIYQLACEQIKTSQHCYALVVHDWSQLQYVTRSEEHTSELQSRENLVCRLLLEKKNNFNGDLARRLEKCWS